MEVLLESSAKNIFKPFLTELIKNLSIDTHKKTILFLNGERIQSSLLDHSVNNIEHVKNNDTESEINYEIDENTHTTLFEFYSDSSTVSKPFFKCKTNLILKQNATLEHIVLSYNKHSKQENDTTITLMANSNYSGSVILIGGQPSLYSQIIHLQDKQATATLHSLQTATHSESQNCSIQIHHHASDCMSKTISRSTMDEKAKGSFKGKIFVHKNAMQTKAFLDNKNLLLSMGAEIEARPELEIYNDNVQCTHGSTVGHLDADALFYLKSRGIPEIDAKHLLIDSFLAPSLQQITHPTLLNFIGTLI